MPELSAKDCLQCVICGNLDKNQTEHSLPSSCIFFSPVYSPYNEHEKYAFSNNAVKGLPLCHIAWQGYVVLRLLIICVHKLNACSAPNVCRRLYCLEIDSALIILVFS